MDKTTYQVLKNYTRQAAIEWQAQASTKNYSYSQILGYQNYFAKEARKYGLIKEFRENGII